MRKDIAGQLFHVVAFNASGRVSGDAANITCTISIDGGTRVTTSDVNPTEIGTTGVYVFTLSQAETDGHELSFIPSSSTSGVQVLGMPSNVIYTSTVDLTANAISAVTAAGVTITPTSATIESRAGKNYILAYTSETNSISVTVLDAGGNAVDLSAKTLGVYWETDAKVSVASLTSGITVSGAGNNVVTFAIPSAVTSEERELIFAIRDQAAPKALYAGGVFDVEYLPAG